MSGGEGGGEGGGGGDRTCANSSDFDSSVCLPLDSMMDWSDGVDFLNEDDISKMPIGTIDLIDDLFYNSTRYGP